jgi:trans-2,3-dihydro-3-hydroxyanthranilate isomerase
VLVPVNFLEHLSRADPAADDLGALLASADAARLCAFTFDTLRNETDLHARFFDPTVEGCERPASGVAVGACGAHLARHAVFDGDRESVRVECGRFLDRPGTIVTTLDEQPQVGGNALTVLDGDLALPPEDDGDGIIEV